MQRVKEKAIELLQNGTVDRVLGWRAGEFFYDLTPGCFTSVEEVERDFVYSVFSGANLSKYLIAESRKGGKVGVFLKPCDSYSFVQLLKEHRILRAFQRGADGVILCGCHPGDCHYTTGNYYARRRMTLLFSMLDFLGIERERTRVEWVSAAEGAKFAATMNDFVATITKLGENRRLEDLRCKE